MTTPSVGPAPDSGDPGPRPEPSRGMQVSRMAKATLGILGGEGVTYYLNPAIGKALAVTLIVLAILLVGVVVFGGQDRCDRVFRLLRWLANRPEPPAPPR